MSAEKVTSALDQLQEQTSVYEIDGAFAIYTLTGALRAVQSLVDENPNTLNVSGEQLGCLLNALVLLADRSMQHVDNQDQLIAAIKRRGHA